MYRTLAFLRAALTTFMAVVCIVGDWLVERNSNSSITKAILDNVTHACVGLLTGLLLFVQVERRISSAEKYAAIIVCCLVSSLIDIDHFIAARSWKLKNATNLRQRPLLHCTTIPLLILAGSFLFDHKFRYKLWCAVIICAFLSHHTRDATRRGYWIWPIGHTRPVPYLLYILLTQLIPFTIGYVLNRVESIGSNPYTNDITNV